ncbi:discoidin domain-containing protein [Haloferula sp. BvORR071]|uniref:discoidin domain-containing protein n=1 Tax=Haloferula sp. BvORR071 TaxID=1396141 RepID=UPI00054F0B38|nr:discoidin domain-containing protein [Haloferula sp. BvORR071]
MNGFKRLWGGGAVRFGLAALAGIGIADAQEKVTSRYAPYAAVANLTEGISWPKGQALPTFATPAPSLDTVMVQDLSQDELITFSALQGRVNRKQPRILLAEGRAEEGPFTWTDTAGLSSRTAFERDRRYELVAKYAGELDGVVLYDPAISPHYRNLAGTVAAQMNAIPVNPQVMEEFKKAGINLKVAADLTGLKFTKPLEIYGHMLERYWPKAEKRLIVSARPTDRGDYHHTRDMAAATGAAVVWLDTRVPEERDMLRKFFSGMKAGEGIALGWYATERTGITTASEFGIGTMPADFFVSSTIYAGTDHKIHMPTVPKMPALENKVYVAVVISDGDNIQYTQHAMRKNWDRIAESRGKVALNWTIAPGLVDIAPVILNYYYGSATPLDCFVTGPSGMGYMMPTNTLNEPGAPVGDSLKDPAMMDGYTRMTETYLQRSGIRVVTIWDDASPPLRKAYEKNCRNLYGVTVQNFKDMRSVAGSIENGRLPFDKLVIPYAGSYQHMSDSLKKEVRDWDGKAPLFLSYQVEAWKEMRADRIVALRDEMAREFPGKVEFVRADHYFNLHNEAKGLPFNLSLTAGVTAKTDGGKTDAAVVLDGSASTLWTAEKEGKQQLDLDLGGDYLVSRCVIRHAGDAGLDPALNTREFALQASTDGKSWKTIHVVKGNKDRVSDWDLPPVKAKQLRVLINNAGADGKARIGEVEVFGKRV